ncbi:hypothetical protein [Halarcobacter sp.]|uniref:hypothetical protein n=1 Tax=Halarcobacter sp. TaxID=2321133 RepID=UPI0029F5960A|nr:hypothetical protein [Halarcobacter sp.]
MNENNNVGRPKEENPRNIQLKIKLTEEENKTLEDLAEKFKMNKSRLVRNLLFGNIEDLKFLDKIKFLPLIQNALAFKDKLQGFDYWEEIKYETKEDYEKAMKEKKD